MKYLFVASILLFASTSSGAQIAAPSLDAARIVAISIKGLAADLPNGAEIKAFDASKNVIAIYDDRVSKVKFGTDKYAVTIKSKIPSTKEAVLKRIQRIRFTLNVNQDPIRIDINPAAVSEFVFTLESGSFDECYGDLIRRVNPTLTTAATTDQSISRMIVVRKMQRLARSNNVSCRRQNPNFALWSTTHAKRAVQYSDQSLYAVW